MDDVKNGNGSESLAKIVVPGEIIKESLDILPGAGTFREGKNIVSKAFGMTKTDGRVISVNPLSGVYIPQKWDYVIAEVSGINFNGWSINIGGPYDANLSIADVKGYIERDADLSKIFGVGDLLFMKVAEVSKTKYVGVSMKDPKARKLSGGFVVELTPSKVPRLIGKAGSMITLIKNRTNCFVSVGQNGRVWIKGEHENVAVKAVEMVEKYAHVSGLTDRISEMLDQTLGKPVEKPEAVKAEAEAPMAESEESEDIY